MENDKIKKAIQKLDEAERQKQRVIDKQNAEKQKAEAIKKEKPKVDFEAKIQNIIKNLEDILIQKAENGEILSINLITQCVGSYTIKGGSISSYEYQEPTVSRFYDSYSREYKSHTHLTTRKEFDDNTYSHQRDFFEIKNEYSPFNRDATKNYNSLRYYDDFKKIINNDALKELCYLLEKENIYPNFVLKRSGECYDKYNCPHITKSDGEYIDDFSSKKIDIILNIDPRVRYDKMKEIAEANRKKDEEKRKRDEARQREAIKKAEEERQSNYIGSFVSTFLFTIYFTTAFAVFFYSVFIMPFMESESFWGYIGNVIVGILGGIIAAIGWPYLLFFKGESGLLLALLAGALISAFFAHSWNGYKK